MNNGSVWKWLAAFFAGIILAGFPAAFVSLTAPSRSDLEQLRRDVASGQVQAARIEERLASAIADNQHAIAQLQAQLAELRSANNGR
jgi:hypothetical protein